MEDGITIIDEFRMLGYEQGKREDYDDWGLGNISFCRERYIL